MKIVLNKLSLQNFKGCKSLEINFADITMISGRNASGKTTIADAWFWLLTGKNFADQTDTGRGAFQVMTTDENGDIIRDLSHSVTATITKDGENVTIGREISEVWETINGTAEPVKKGNQTKFYYNGLEVKKAKFAELIANFVNDSFRLISVPGAFMALDWKMQREMLLAMAGDITLESIAQPDETAVLSNILQIGYTEWKKAISTTKKKVKDEIATIPGRIDTAEKLKPETKDFAALEKRLAELNAMQSNGGGISAEIAKISKAKAEKMQKYNDTIANINSKIYELRNKRQSLEFKQVQEKTAFDNVMKIKASEKAAKISENEKAENELAELRIAFDKRAAETYTPSDCGIICPLCDNVSCNNPIIIANKEESNRRAVSKFYEDRESDLNAINEKAVEINGIINNNRAAIDVINAELAETFVMPYVTEIAEIDKKIMAINATTPTAPDLTTETEQYNKLLQSHEAEKAANDEIRKEIADINFSLGTRDQIAKCNKEIAMLNARREQLQEQLGAIEREEYQGDNLKKRQMAEVERRVNVNFSNIKFKLFEKQLNGGEVDCCTMLINGVSYGHGANKAAEINAALEICDYLQKGCNLYLPVFVDNCESVNNVMQISAQQIQLRVTDTDLTII